MKRGLDAMAAFKHGKHSLFWRKWSRQWSSAGRAIVEPMERRVLLSAGALDTTFGTKGNLFFQPPANTSPLWLGVAAQPNGGIDVLPIFEGSPSKPLPLVVEQLKPDGTLNTAFGKSGLAAAIPAANSATGQLIVQPDGDILVISGETIGRLTPSGALDTSFAGGKGYETLPEGLSASDGALQADGKIVVLASGYFPTTPSPGTYQHGVFRFNADGSVDTSYGVKGFASIGSAGFTAPGGIALDAQGRVVVSLAGTAPNASFSEFEVERLATTGHADTTFGTSAFATDGGDPDNDAGASSITVGPNGTIYLGANYDNNDYIEAFNTNGVKQGGVQLPLSMGFTGFTGTVAGLTVGPDNNVIATGNVYQNSDSNVLVYDTDFPGSYTEIDYTVGEDDYGSSDFGDMGATVALQPDGKILVAGISISDGSSGPNGAPTDELTLSRVTNTLTASNGVINGAVFNDANKDDKQDNGETGLAGWQVYLDLTDTGTYNSNDPTTTTNASGKYSFAGLNAGTYVVRAIPPASWQQTTVANGYGQRVTLTEFGVANDANFGFVHQATGVISGTVFNDVNKDDKQDDGEKGLAGWTVYIDLTNSGKKSGSDPSTTTNSSGQYSFTGLAAGTYIVRVIPPAKWIQTTPLHTYGQHVTIAAGGVANGENFGLHFS